jgi:dolichol-phosphate mannosyltransferase
MVDISIVIPVYFNEGSLEKTFIKLKDEVFAAFEKLTFEVIFINDGSLDGSLKEIIAIKEKNPLIVEYIELTRNFGQVHAIYAGYEYSNGKAILNIAADLQEPITLIKSLIQSYLDNEGSIIIGQRIERDESLYRKLTSDIFYALMRKLSFKNLPKGGFDIALIKREVVDVLISLKEAHPFWQGQLLWTGYPIKIIPYNRLKREVGISRWTFSKKIKYLLDGVLNYSYAPLRICSILGVISFVLGIIYSILIVIQYFIWNAPFNGWSPIMISIMLFSGLQLLMLGLIGEYLWRTLEQTKPKPRYVIKSSSILNKKEKE